MCNYFNKQKAGYPCIVPPVMPIYLASTYFKYSDPQKTNKIGFEDLKSLMCCVFTWIYKDQLFNTISKNEILFSLFPCNHQRISKVNGKYVWGREEEGWMGGNATFYQFL